MNFFFNFQEITRSLLMFNDLNLDNRGRQSCLDKPKSKLSGAWWCREKDYP